MTHGATLGGHVVQEAVKRAGVDPNEIEDVIFGCAFPEGATGSNIARQIALRAGLPITTSGMTVNRFCSGLQTIAIRAACVVEKAPGARVGRVDSVRADEVKTHISREWSRDNRRYTAMRRKRDVAKARTA